MGFTQKIHYFLVHHLLISNREATTLIKEGKVKINDVVIEHNCVLPGYSSVKVNDKEIRPATNFVYLAFHKPKGFESTLNRNVSNHLADFFKDFENLAIAGRLDKESEGLLLLSNDGKWVESICHPKTNKAKEYIVELDKETDDHFCKKFSEGVFIGNYLTKPSLCNKIGPKLLVITLFEGKNRQIRRMCKALGYNVIKLKRTRIDCFLLGKLSPGEFDFVKI